MEVLKTYRFAPAYQSGRRVGVIAHIDVAFNLPVKVVSLPGGFFYVKTGLTL